MTSCKTASMPVDESHHEYCMDLLDEHHQDNTLPMVSTTPHMPPIIKTQDRPVVLYMAPIHKQDSLCSNASSNESDNQDENMSSGVRNVRIE